MSFLHKYSTSNTYSYQKFHHILMDCKAIPTIVVHQLLQYLQPISLLLSLYMALVKNKLVVLRSYLFRSAILMALYMAQKYTEKKPSTPKNTIHHARPSSTINLNTKQKNTTHATRQWLYFLNESRPGKRCCGHRIN